jgi:hypothetical protein
MELPEIRLDWWDTVNHVQRTAVLPGHTINVLPSEMTTSVVTPPVLPGEKGASSADVSAVNRVLSASSLAWKVSTAAFAVLWLLTLFLYLRRAAVNNPLAATQGLESTGEKELLKHFRASCHQGDASAARKALAQWIRNYSPQALRGSMRDFGAVCGDGTLQDLIEQLDVYGFKDKAPDVWKGEPLWRAFENWRSTAVRPQTLNVGEKPDLYAR